MPEVLRLCNAKTKQGAPCKKLARANSAYCYIHRDLETHPSQQPTSRPVKNQQKANVSQAELDQLIVEIEQLVAELRTQSPNFTPPPFSRAALLGLLGEQTSRLMPESQLTLMRQLKSNLEGTAPSDFLDPETWKGLWYILNYSLQLQRGELQDRLRARLAALPGAEALMALKNNFAGTTPADLLDIDTWKGAWFILNHTLRLQADTLKQRLLGIDE